MHFHYFDLFYFFFQNIRDIAIDDALVTMFNKKSLTWKEVKKLKKSGKVLALRFFEDGFWNTMKQVNEPIDNIYRC